MNTQLAQITLALIPAIFLATAWYFNGEALFIFFITFFLALWKLEWNEKNNQ